MRTTTSAILLVAFLPLTACGHDAAPNPKPAVHSSRPAATPHKAQSAPLGTTVKTTGAQSLADGTQGGGTLEVTPTTVLYIKKAMGSTTKHGVFALITVKDRAPEGAAAESAMLEGGGWQYIAPDGQVVGEGDGNAAGIAPEGFTSGGVVPAGAYQWQTLAFDLAPAQRGGTLAYVDGAHHTYRWRIAAADSGPELAALRKGMEGNYG